MPQPPDISILLPVYNAGLFLEDCLQSILQQTFTRWELLAVDDFSTDNSADILQAFAKNDSRIQFFSNTQKGIIPALRLAFAQSSGQYITRMDADDRMLPQKLEQLHHALQTNGKGSVATGLVRYFSESELGGGYQKYEQWINRLTRDERNFEEIYKECVIPSPCWMLHRSDLELCGAFQPNRYPEDYDLAFRFYEQQLKVVGVPEVLHEWRDHPTRTSRTDPTYANPQYFELKLHYFLRLDYDQNRPLVLWGAGSKGKAVAKKLQASDVPFHWICETPGKIGKHIYGQHMQSPAVLPQLQRPQILIAVSAPDGQQEIQAFLDEHHFENMEDYFFLC